MPRKRRRKKKQDAYAEAFGLEEPAAKRSSRREKHVFIANYWRERIQAGLQVKERYLREAKEVVGMFKSRHDVFMRGDVRANFMKFSGGAAISVPKAAQARNALGPHLYQSNPKRELTPRTDDGVLLALARVLEAYVNYTPGESKLVREVRKAIDDSLLRGRGFMQTGFDPYLEVITSWFVSSLDVLIDPDVYDIKHAEWVAIRKREPLWRVKRRLKSRQTRWRLKGLEANMQLTYHPEEDTDRDGADSDAAKHRFLPSNAILEYWEVYSKMGTGVRGFVDGENDDTPDYTDDQDYVRLEIALSHDVPIDQTEWEIPLYLDRDWPIVPLDLVEAQDELWPISLMSLVTPLQNGLDLVYSLRLNSCKERGKVRVIVPKDLETKAVDQIRFGSPSECIAVEAKQGWRLDERFKVLDMGALSPEIRAMGEDIERQMDATTGVTPTLHGMTPAAQDRSAAASQLRGQAVNARVGDMAARVEEWSTDLARHEAIAVRTTLEAEDVAPAVRNRSLELGFLVSLEIPGGIDVPIRDRRSREERQSQRDRGEEELTLESIFPSASNYFATPEEAVSMAERVIEEITSRAVEGDERMAALAMAVGAVQDPSELIRPVTVEDVWRDTAGMTSRELMREYSYSIATGSTQKLDPQRKQELVEDEMQNAFPIALQMAQETGNTLPAEAIWRHRNEVYEVPPDERVPLFPPGGPPQPQQQPPQEEAPGAAPA